jgi:hypothetical protein
MVPEEKGLVRSLIFSRRTNIGLIAAAGVFLLVEAIASMASPDPDDWDCNSKADYVTNALDALAFFAVAGGILGMRGEYNDRWNWVGRVGAVTAFVGAIGAGVNNPIEHCAHIETLGLVLWVPSSIALLVGLMAMGVGMVLVPPPRDWLGVFLAVCTFAGSALVETGGTILLAAMWLFLAAVLALRRPRSPATDADQ